MAGWKLMSCVGVVAECLGRFAWRLRVVAVLYGLLYGLCDNIDFYRYTGSHKRGGSKALRAAGVGATSRTSPFSLVSTWEVYKGWAFTK